MAEIKFFAPGTDSQIYNLNGSGVGFYGTGFGNSVAVASYQETTFITNSNGTAEGPQIHNIMWLAEDSGVIDSAAAGVPLTKIPNNLATLNVRFEHTSAVKTQNTKLRIFDRVSIDNAASGVLTQVCEIIHPDPVQNDNGSGDTTWHEFDATTGGVEIDLVASPGESGLRPNGPNTSDDRHDYYVAISASPSSIGAKTFAMYVELEYVE